MGKGYLHSVRYYFPLSVFLFLISVYAGYSVGEQFPVSMLEMLREIFVEVEEWRPFWLMIFIFLNNSMKCFLVILLGFMLGIFPLLFVAINGLILGLITFEVGKLRGLPFAFATTLPHGVIEIPMVLLSSAIGIRIGYETVNRIREKGALKESFPFDIVSS